MLIFFFFFIVVGLRVNKFDILKLVILLEFLYIIVIFVLMRYFSISFDFLICIIIFSASERVFALCLIIIFRKFFQVKDNVFFNFFLVSLSLKSNTSNILISSRNYKFRIIHNNSYFCHK